MRNVVWSGLKWLRTGSHVGYFVNMVMNLVFHEGSEFS
jgi:hypothetical protein